MKKLDVEKTAIQLAKSIKKPCLFLAFTAGKYDDIICAAPYLNMNDIGAITSGFMTVICDSLKEATDLYNQTVGDDGPTKLNTYNGVGRVYAVLINEDGDVLDDNT